MSRRCRGITLVELLVALFLVELAALVALATFVASHRLDRLARDRSAFDLARLDTLRARTAAVDCLAAPRPEARPVTLVGGANRPPLLAAVRCGR